MNVVRRGGFLARCVLVTAVTALLAGGLGCRDREGAKPGPLLCYVGGTMQPAIQELAKRYEAKTGRKVEVDYADSGSLLIKIEQTKRGDLYVAHDPFLEALMRKGLGSRGRVVASLTPVIVVRKDDTKGIAGFRDLAKPGLRVALTHPVYSTGGWVVTAVAKRAGIEEKLEANIVDRPRSGAAAATAVSMGAADAAICWNAVAHLRSDKLKAIPIEPELMPVRDVDVITTATFGRIDLDYVRVTVATLKASKQPEAASAFAEFVASPEAAAVWAEFGFSPADPRRSRADAAPEIAGSIFVHCAAGMRRPISRLAEEFERQTGVKVELSYGGSNVLLGQIELTRVGDVYIAGDADYIDMAEQKGLVKSKAAICHFIPVILVAKGNPKQIGKLSDATREGVRIGQGDEKAAAVGRLTPRLLELNGVDRKAWDKNVVLTTPTVNELGLKVQLGTIDAAVVWRCIALDYENHADIVPIDREKNIFPEVAGAVLSFAKNTKAAAAFLDFLASERGRRVLEESGYTVDKP